MARLIVSHNAYCAPTMKAKDKRVFHVENEIEHGRVLCGRDLAMTGEPVVVDREWIEDWQFHACTVCAAETRPRGVDEPWWMEGAFA